jgi:hypothetical protein
MAGDWSHSPEAEQSLLGALLLDNTAWRRISDVVSAEDLYTEDHRAIFRAIAGMIAAGQAADLVTVTESLQRANPEAFAAAGGAAYLGALVQNTPSALNIRRYAELVKDRALCRRLDAIGAEISRTARAGDRIGAWDRVAAARERVAGLVLAAAPPTQLRADTAGELINADLPEMAPLLVPWLFEQNLVLVHAWRGIGKTHFAFGIAFAVAAGARFLEYSAPRARGVLYLDGEMPGPVLQKRLAELASAYGEVPDLLRIVTPARQGKPMPDLATFAGQAEFDALVNEHTALIVVDNISSLVRSGGAENESESWGPVAEWALRHRRAGRAVMFVHHAGKSGAQRGTSKREDLLDVSISLKRPQDYQEEDGASFVVNFTKGRDLKGADITPIEARLVTLPDGRQQWTCKPAASALQEQICMLWEGGELTLNDIHRELGCSKSHAHRRLVAAMEKGELQRPYPQKPRAKTTK